MAGAPQARRVPRTVLPDLFCRMVRLRQSPSLLWDRVQHGKTAPTGSGSVWIYVLNSALAALRERLHIGDVTADGGDVAIHSFHRGFANNERRGPRSAHSRAP